MTPPPEKYIRTAEEVIRHYLSRKFCDPDKQERGTWENLYEECAVIMQRELEKDQP